MTWVCFLFLLCLGPIEFEECNTAIATEGGSHHETDVAVC